MQRDALQGRADFGFAAAGVDPPLPLEMPARTVDNAFYILELAYALVASGEVIKARALIQLASTAARIVQSAELERRLVEVEAAIASREGVT